MEAAARDSDCAGAESAGARYAHCGSSWHSTPPYTRTHTTHPGLPGLLERVFGM